jgi:nitrate reductase alpha subunit
MAAKGIGWNTEHEVDFLKKLNGEKNGRAKIETILMPAKLSFLLRLKQTERLLLRHGRPWQDYRRDHTHLALPKEEEKIRFRDIQAQPRKIISSPTWSGLESEHVCYNAGYTTCMNLSLAHADRPSAALSGSPLDD